MRALGRCEGKESWGKNMHRYIFVCCVLNKEKLLHGASDYQEKLSK